MWTGDFLLPSSTLKYSFVHVKLLRSCILNLLNRVIMSFLSYKKCIEEGDTVILYVNPQCMYPVTVKPTKLNKLNEEIENTFQTSYGCLKVESLIGQQYGSKVILTKGSKLGWAHVLHPTSELWTVTLPHRTQIIYTPDISMILFQLELKPGSIVVEAGNLDTS